MILNSDKLTVTIISPEKILYSGEADSIRMPGVEGSFGILCNHAPMIAELDIGLVELSNGTEISKYIVDGGFLEIRSNVVNVLVHSGDKVESLDIEVEKVKLDALMDKEKSPETGREIKKIQARIKTRQSHK